MGDIEREMGSLKIDNDVLGTIAGTVAHQVPGVHRVVRGLVGGLAQLIRERPNAGIKVIVGEGEVRFELSVIVNYGVNIPEVTHEVQKQIREQVQEMSGLKVSQVDVIVRGVYLAGKKDEEPGTEEGEI